MTWVMSLTSCALGILLAVTNFALGQTPRPTTDVVMPEEFGAIGNDGLDDTAAMRRAVATGKRVVLGSHQEYRISSAIDIPTGGGISSDGTAWLVLATEDGAFDNPTGAVETRKRS